MDILCGGGVVLPGYVVHVVSLDLAGQAVTASRLRPLPLTLMGGDDLLHDSLGNRNLEIVKDISKSFSFILPFSFVILVLV